MGQPVSKLASPQVGGKFLLQGLEHIFISFSSLGVCRTVSYIFSSLLIDYVTFSSLSQRRFSFDCCVQLYCVVGTIWNHIHLSQAAPGQHTCSLFICRISLLHRHSKSNKSICLWSSISTMIRDHLYIQSLWRKADWDVW